MAPKKRKVAVSKHLICCNCCSWVHFVSSGCGKSWAETRGESFVFTCKGCTEVKGLVKEVEGLKQMVEEMMEKVTGLRLEDKGEETESRVTKTGANQDSEEAAGDVRTEEMITGVEDEGEIRTEERKEALWCNLVTGHITITIGVVYRCPNITIQNNEKIHNAISEVNKGDCIIMGDFNHGNIKWDSQQSTGVEDQQFLCLV